MGYLAKLLRRLVWVAGLAFLLRVWGLKKTLRGSWTRSVSKKGTPGPKMVMFHFRNFRDLGGSLSVNAVSSLADPLDRRPLGLAAHGQRVAIKTACVATVRISAN